ncbi:MAG: hypothetical protein JWM11_7046, partial [Planctomycetaceae bacterium]|nr:hypothetical protein [Planctomycetaceae bacterium]
METPPATSEGSVVPVEPESWSVRTKTIVTLFLIWHLSAVFVGPAAVDPTSGLMLNLFQVYRPYLDALYLNHGYHFF